MTMRAIALVFLLLMTQAAMPQTPSSTSSADQSDLLKPEQLEALVSPIALYPDTLLAEVLMASTYPLEVIEAERWVQDNKTLKGEQLKAAVDKQKWDDRVKSLTATPDVLALMSSKLDWTRQLGDAVLAQQPDVMDAVQKLRTKAQANKKLTSNKQQTVSTQEEAGKQVIVIQPTDPNTVYVPYYDPGVVYGSWPYAAYPPYYFGAPGYIGAGVIASGIAFGAGWALGRWAGGGCCWGGGMNWGNNNININRNVNNIGSGNWTHNAAHRGGVRYNNANVAQKFGGNRNVGGGAQNRMDFRGRSGQQVLQPGRGGGDRGNLGAGGAGGRNAGNRPGGGGAANRPGGGGAGNRPGGGGAGNRPGGGAAGNRPGGGGAGNRPGGGNAFGNVGSGRAANLQSSRGHASMGGGGGGGFRGGGGGGGGFRGGGSGGRGGGGGRRSDVNLKHDIVFLGRLDNGIGFYRFTNNGGRKPYVGVMAQEVQAIMPAAVVRGSDGYLRVYYDKLGLKFQTYDEWIASGARVPITPPVAH